jgi:hypothetical protein
MATGDNDIPSQIGQAIGTLIAGCIKVALYTFVACLVIRAVLL